MALGNFQISKHNIYKPKSFASTILFKKEKREQRSTFVVFKFPNSDFCLRVYDQKYYEVCDYNISVELNPMGTQRYRNVNNEVQYL